MISVVVLSSLYFVLFLLFYFHPTTPLNGLGLSFSSSQNLYRGSLSSEFLDPIMIIEWWGLMESVQVNLMELMKRWCVFSSNGICPSHIYRDFSPHNKQKCQIQYMPTICDIALLRLFLHYNTFYFTTNKEHTLYCSWILRH